MFHSRAGHRLSAAVFAFATSVATAQTSELTPHQAARRAIAWIGQRAVQVEGVENAVMFPDGGERTPTPGDAPIYGGTAGILLFLENARVALRDTGENDEDTTGNNTIDREAITALADRTAAGLRATAVKRDDGPTWAPGQREGAASLYVGDAGIGHAFLVRAILRDDAEALKFATEIGDALIARADRFDEMLCWDDQVEIIYGAAGTALFLLELAEATGESRFRDTALRAGRWMISESEVMESMPVQRQWRWQLGGNTDYVGFSHGTAGVAYALLRIGIACEDDACIAAARDGAERLRKLAIREDGRVRWPVVCDSETSLGGWCHGAPGTARLLLLLHAHTGDKAYLEDALASAQWVIDQAGPADSKTPPKFPPSFCCGVAGVIDFFCDLHRATGEDEFADFARRASDYLIAAASADDAGIRWPSGPNAHRKAAQREPVDLMLGAAGCGFALLRVGLLDAAEDPIVSLPDRRVRL